MSVCLVAALLTALSPLQSSAAESAAVRPIPAVGAASIVETASTAMTSAAVESTSIVKTVSARMMIPTAEATSIVKTTIDDGPYAGDVCEVQTGTVQYSGTKTGDKDSFLAVFWNLENFYDYFDDGTNSSDSEFSPHGKRHWTKQKFTDKCNSFGKTILSIASKYGKLPNIIAVAEVENSYVLKRIADSEVLRKCGYRYVHYDSPDRRGIDVAMLYRISTVTVAASRPVHIYSEDGNTMRTRDILYSKILWHPDFDPGQSNAKNNEKNYGKNNGKNNGKDTVKNSDDCKSETPDTPHIPDTLHIIVNHHPSKYSGSKSSAGVRMAAMSALKSLCDSTSAVSEAPIVMTGDFNDTADGEQFALLGNGYENLSLKYDGKAGIGSIRFNGKWELIDHFIVSREIADMSTMEIYEAPFLLEKDKTHTGWKPLRTYSGPRYIGGVSDHLPIVLELVYH